jgi:ABC-type glutathione transport system ATPase component
VLVLRGRGLGYGLPLRVIPRRLKRSLFYDGQGEPTLPLIGARCVASRTRTATIRTKINMNGQRESTEHDRSGPSPDFIELLGISKHFGGVRALNNVDFTIRPAEVHCLAGENGCGKSTLIKILAGVHAPDSGKIVIDRQAHPHLSPAASQRAGIQIIYQDLSLFPNLSVAENIMFRHHVEKPGRLVRQREIVAQARQVMCCVCMVIICSIVMGGGGGGGVGPLPLPPLVLVLSLPSGPV